MDAGRNLHSEMKNDVESGFVTIEPANYTLDQVETMNQVKRMVEELENKLDRIQHLWHEKEMLLGAQSKVMEMEEAMKTVRWKSCRTN